MKAIGKYSYNITFWISRVITIFVSGICLTMMIHAKYVLPEKISFLLAFFIENIEKFKTLLNDWLLNKGIVIYNLPLPSTTKSFFKPFCKNSQSIDLLLILFVIIVLIAILTIKLLNKRYKYFFFVIFILYIVMYFIFNLQILLFLAIITPITLIIIQILNKRCPIQKTIILMPIVGEILCIKNIVKHIFEDCSEKFKNISLLVVALVVSNIACFLIPYEADKDFKNLIMENWTYSIRTYMDNMIVSGDNELILIDNHGKINHIENDNFGRLEDFVVNKNRSEIYMYNFVDFLILDAKTLNIINRIDLNLKDVVDIPRICCNNFSVIFIFEFYIKAIKIDLNTYNMSYIKRISYLRDGLIYNKYRNCFLVSFHDDKPFLQEIDIDNKKLRKIKMDKNQGYLAMSERNKEIYIAFHQQGKIGVYDAETMKLKRKIKSNYTVKDITYDEELNVLIAPSYFTGYVDIFLMDGSDKLLTREFVGYELREGCFDPQKENLYVCSPTGLYKKKIDIKKLIREFSKN